MVDVLKMKLFYKYQNNFIRGQKSHLHLVQLIKAWTSFYRCDIGKIC